MSEEKNRLELSLDPFKCKNKKRAIKHYTVDLLLSESEDSYLISMKDEERAKPTFYTGQVQDYEGVAKVIMDHIPKDRDSNVVINAPGNFASLEPIGYYINEYRWIRPHKIEKPGLSRPYP